MATRTVSVKLVADVASYVGGINTAAASTARLGESATASTSKAKSGFDIAGKGALIMGGAVVAGLGMAIGKAMDFEKSMSAVSAATGATAGKLEDLRDAAMKAGADTQFSATEAADAITEMAKAGVSAKDIMGGGLTGALSLAAAGQIDVAEAAGIASTAMTQFSLTGKDIPHVADLLAAGAGKAMGSVDDLGQALNQAGLVASAAGLSIEETTGGLAAFASAGLVGSDAGTSLKVALQALQAPTDKSAGLMASLGINMYDANGNMLSLSGMAGQLQEHLGGLTQEQRNSALATIFGSDAVRVANVLYKEGAAGIQEWTAKVNDQGYAADQARKLNDNLAGDLERLGGAFDKLLTTIGEGAMGPLRELVQAFTGILGVGTDLIGFFQSLPGPVQTALVMLGAMAALKGPLGGMFDGLKVSMSGVTGSVSAFSEALGYARANGDGLGTVLRSVGSYAGDTVRGGLGSLVSFFGGPWGIALAGAGAAVSAIGSAMAKTEQQTKDWADALAEGGRAAREATAEMEQAPGVLDRFTLALSGHNAGMGAAAARTREAKQALEDYRSGLDPVAEAQSRVSEWTNTLSDRMTNGTASVEDQRTAQERLAYWSAVLAGRQSELKTATEGATVASTDAAPAIAGIGTTAGMTVGQMEAATKATEEWMSTLQKIGESFVEPLSVYKGLLDEKTAAEKTQAEATADATTSSSDSWKDYVGEVTVSMDEYANKLQEQLDAQDNWRKNLGIIAQRAGLEVAQHLAEMGAEGVQLTAQMANGTDAEVQRMGALITRDAAAGGASAAASLDTQMKVMAAVGAAGGKATAAGIAQQLGLGVTEVARIAAGFGVTLADGVNPVLTALGRPRVVPLNSGPRIATFADGGFTGAGAKYTPAGIVHAGEFVMPREAVNRIGVGPLGMLAGLPGYATGGFVNAAAVPRPRSTAPYSGAVGQPGDAAMGKEFDEVHAFMVAQDAAKAAAAAAAAASAGNSAPFAGMAAGGVQRWLPLVLQALAMVGQPASLAQTTLRRMNQESGGNPVAINRTDINALRGTPSKGLMQVIDPTFRAYAMPGYNSNVYDPLSNILASMRYAISRYGSLAAAYNKAGGYRDGTDFVPMTGLYQLHKGEQVVPASVAAKSREFSGGAGGVGSGTAPNVTVQARVFIGTREITDIVRVEAGAIVGKWDSDVARNVRSALR